MRLLRTQGTVMRALARLRYIAIGFVLGAAFMASPAVGMILAAFATLWLISDLKD